MLCSAPQRGGQSPFYFAWAEPRQNKMRVASPHFAWVRAATPGGGYAPLTPNPGKKSKMWKQK